jgi:hypothetical protein
MKTLLAATLVTLALSLSATIAEAGGVREVIPPAQQHYNVQPEAADAVVPSAGREVIPPAQQHFNAQPEGANAVVPSAGREVIPPADQRG